MTDDEKRIKIAKACGWLDLHKYQTQLTGRHELGFGARDFVPDYLNDLNAMHEAEKQLSPDQWSEYLHQLQILTQSEYRYEVENRFLAAAATARQRAEAFGKTLGLW